MGGRVSSKLRSNSPCGCVPALYHNLQRLQARQALTLRRRGPSGHISGRFLPRFFPSVSPATPGSRPNPDHSPANLHHLGVGGQQILVPPERHDLRRWHAARSILYVMSHRVGRTTEHPCAAQSESQQRRGPCLYDKKTFLLQRGQVQLRRNGCRSKIGHARAARSKGRRTGGGGGVPRLTAPSSMPQTRRMKAGMCSLARTSGCSPSPPAGAERLAEGGSWHAETGAALEE